VLARKWRPKTFKEVIGQPHVLTALENGLLQDRMHHAYLFSGTRGVGKTTIARILAKSLNCETGVTATPCGECANCQAIDQGRFVDLLEIDAASRTKVDDTRELLDNVQYKPAQGRYKVYLIDEVHMLSKHSFNALLKTLEEPPEYVKFLLATTDPQKLPITVLSRCLQFHLKAILPEQIEQQLAAILTHEKATFEAPALRVIAKSADGSMRDALSLTDQALAFGAGHIQYASVLKMLGTIDQSHLHYLLHFIASGNSKKVFEKIQEFVHLGADFSALHQELANLCHQIALMQLNINPNVTKKSTVQLLAERLTPEEVQLFYQIALQGFKDYPYAPNGKIALEMTVMRLLAFRPANYIDIDESMIGHLNQVEADAPTDISLAQKESTPLPERVTDNVSKASQSTSTQTNPSNNTQLDNQTPVIEPSQAQVVDTKIVMPPVEVQNIAIPMVDQHKPTRAIERESDYSEDASVQNEPELHNDDYHVNKPTVHDTLAAEAPTTQAVFSSEHTPVVSQDPGANFNLAATTNSRNMLRSHRLKREELKKNNAATEQTTIDKNDRFAASESTPIATKTTAPIVNNSSATIVKKEVKPLAQQALAKPIFEDKSSKQREFEVVNNNQDLPPLSSYQDQSDHINNDEYDYPDYDNFPTETDISADNYVATGDELEGINVIEPIVEHYQPPQVQNESIHQEVDQFESAEQETAGQHKLVDDYFSDRDVPPVIGVEIEATSPEHQTVKNKQPVSLLNEPITSSHEVITPNNLTSANFDISTITVADNAGTEVVLVKDDNFPRPEIDIAGYVEDKMTDPWFLAIKAMQLSGFEKLLAKNCVMQQNTQEIMLTLHESQGHLLNNQTLCDGLKNILRDYYGKQYLISIEVGELKDGHTPMDLEKIVYQQYLTNAQVSIENDAIVQTFVSDYAAKVYENSVIPL